MEWARSTGEPRICLDSGKHQGQLGNPASCLFWAMSTPLSKYHTSSSALPFHTTPTTHSFQTLLLATPETHLRQAVILSDNYQSWTVSVSLVNPGLSVGGPI